MKFNLPLSIILLILFIFIFPKSSIVQIYFNIGIGFPLSFFTNIDSQILENGLVFFNYNLSYSMNNNFILGLYIEHFLSLKSLIKTFEIFAWIILFPISFPLSLENI